MKQSPVWWQHILPQHALSRLMGGAANCKAAWFKNWAMKTFISHYGVDMAQAKIEDYRAYANFNDFFTRHLKPELRPFDASKDAVISPVDGSVSEIGPIQQQQILQAKGKFYSVKSLLGGHESLAQSFMNGSFLTAYLSPKDYHRIHMPIDARLVEMHYVPGKLFSVNGTSVKHIDKLFARNERAVCVFESELGCFALVAVGALIVGSIETSWHGVVNPKHGCKPCSWDYRDQDIRLNKGDEMGYFKLGSTIVLLFQAGKVNWKSALQADSALTMGQTIGEC